MSMLFVVDSSLGLTNGLQKAGQLAATLFDTRAIQSWDLADAAVAIEINLFPSTAQVVTDHGGLVGYKAWLVAQFVQLGYKEDTADEPTDTPVDTSPPTDQPVEGSN